MVVALLALFVSMGGVGYAALKLPRNSVGSKHIKPEAVNSSDVADGSLLAGDFGAGQLPAGPQGLQGEKGDTGPSTGSAGGDLTGSFPDPSIKPGAVDGAKVAPNSLTGAEVNESMLGKVGSAASADTLGGLRAVKISFDVAHNNPPNAVEVLNLGGLRMTAECRNFGDGLDVKAFTTKNDADAFFASTVTLGPNDTDEFRDLAGAQINDRNFDTDDVLEIDNNWATSSTSGVASLVYGAPDGSSVVVQFALSERPTGCLMTGIAIGG
jgi:hypothetical protein